MRMIKVLKQKYLLPSIILKSALLYQDRQTDRYFIDRKKLNSDLFVIEIRERYVHVYTTLLIC